MFLSGFNIWYLNILVIDYNLQEYFFITRHNIPKDDRDTLVPKADFINYCKIHFFIILKLFYHLHLHSHSKQKMKKIKYLHILFKLFKCDILLYLHDIDVVSV